MYIYIYIYVQELTPMKDLPVQACPSRLQECASRSKQHSCRFFHASWQMLVPHESTKCGRSRGVYSTQTNNIS